jgi:hypothetical protein
MTASAGMAGQDAHGPERWGRSSLMPRRLARARCKYVHQQAALRWRPLMTSLRHLLAPRSVAVIGASRERGKAGRAIADNIRDAGYAGTVYPGESACPAGQRRPVPGLGQRAARRGRPRGDRGARRRGTRRGGAVRPPGRGRARGDHRRARHGRRGRLAGDVPPSRHAAWSARAASASRCRASGWTRRVPLSTPRAAPPGFSRSRATLGSPWPDASTRLSGIRG